MEPIFHIAEADAWIDARRTGAYRESTLGKSLDDVGFIHCSFRHQVEAVANRAYGGREHLVLLVIDPAKVTAEIRTENLDGGADPYPHIYGPLNVDAVSEALPYPPEPDAG